MLIMIKCTDLANYSELVLPSAMNTGVPVPHL